MVEQFLTESPTARLPSGSVLEILPPRQRLVFLARAAHIPMTEVARLLHVSRETVHKDIRQAWAALKPVMVGPGQVRLRYDRREGG